MSAKRDEYLTILYMALAEPIGLVIATSSVERARQKLYTARRASLDPELDDLQIRISPFTDGDLVIVRQHTAVRSAPSTEGAIE